jgi:RimJ/RimL family protein N-acetyltransferase
MHNDDDGVPWPREVPKLTTARLLLRAVHPARDAAGMLQLLSDPEVTRHSNAPVCTTVAEVRAALEQFPRRFAAKEMELHRIEAGVLPGNDASARVLQKLGFRTGGRFSGLAHIS